MSYVTGNLSDFENRLHQGAIDSSSLSSYISEGNIYLGSGTGIVSVQMSGKWEREARQCNWRFTADITKLALQQFGGGGPAAPSGFAISTGSSAGSVSMSWTTGAAPAATGYEIWRGVDGASPSLYVTQTGLNFTDASGATPTAGHYQTYEVRGIWTGSPGTFTSTRSIGNTLPGNNSITSISYSDMQVMLGDLVSTNNTNLTSVSAPVLARVAGIVNLSTDVNLTSVSMPALSIVGAQLFLGDSTAITTLNLTGLTMVGGDFQAQTKTSLTSFNFPVLQTVGGPCIFYNCPAVTGVNFNSLKYVGGGGRFDVNSNTSLPYLSMPAFTGVDGDLTYSFCNILTGVSFPVIKNIGGQLVGNDCPLLQSVSIGTLTGLIGGIQHSNCAVLKFISLTGVVAINGDIDISINSQLTGFNLPNVIYQDGVLFNANGNALGSTTVNQILARFVASSSISSTIDLSGGTNGAPTGQGLTDKATLQGAGNIVTTN